MSGIDTTRDDYDKMLPIWKQNRDVVEVKNVEKYLRRLEPTLPESDPYRKARQKEYESGAMFYPLVQQPVTKIVAASHKREPTADIPRGSEYLLNDVDGNGVTLFQQSKRTFKEILTMARGGLYVAVPPEGGDARILFAEAEQIINWNTIVVDGVRKLSLVVIKSIVWEQDGAYESKPVEEFLEMRFDGSVVTGRIVRKDDKGEEIPQSEGVLRNGNGSNLDHIPFYFIGELNNDEKIDRPTISPLCRLNIGHYRNSADFEESAYYVGAATYSPKEQLNEEAIKDMKALGISVGSKNMFPFPVQIAAPPETTMSRTGMMDKIEAIANMLASFVGVQSVKTATQVDSENDEKTNVLVMIANNVSDAYTKALNTAVMLNNQTGEAEYKISDEFIKPSATADMLREMRECYLTKSLPVESYFKWCKRHSLIDQSMTFEEFTESVERVDMPNLEQ